MPVFSEPENFIISGGQFTDITNNNSGPTGIDILLEVSCPAAAYDSSARSYPPRCFPGTREQYIQDIVQWAVPDLGATPTPIYWMRGQAGVGKSAVAQTCAENLKSMEKLGAAFFFSISGRDKPQKFFPSIAYQLSTIHPPYHDHIDGKIRRDKTLIDKAMSFQFQYLIDEPLRELALKGKGIGKRIVIIVDGLDECEGTGAQSEIIHIVAKAASDGTLPLCWAFFSRPSPHIEATLTRPSIAPYCHKVTLPISRDADREIELYLRNGFENILLRHNALMSSQWPSVEDMETLVGAARGSFIYATTVLRFVDHLGSLGPQKRLREIIDVILDPSKRGLHSGTSVDGPFAELDAFYILILQRIPMEIVPLVHLLLALISQTGGLGVMLGVNLLGLSMDEFKAICNHASAVVCIQDPGKALVPDPTIDTSRTYAQIKRGVPSNLIELVDHTLGGEVVFYHKSFEDFLLDPARSGGYSIKGSEALAKHYLKMILDYDRSYCWEDSELVLAPGTTDSASSLSCAYTNEFVNSLIKARVYTELGDEDAHSFSTRHTYGALDANRDFRKWLHLSTHLRDDGDSLHSSLLWGCRCRYGSYLGTRITWIVLAEFNVNEFKLMIKQRKRANIIQRYHPNLTSRLKSLFRDKPREHFESALYRRGHGGKSIFWYWQIDYESGHYRDFEAIDLAEGEKKFRDFERKFSGQSIGTP